MKYICVVFMFICIGRSFFEPKWEQSLCVIALVFGAAAMVIQSVDDNQRKIKEYIDSKMDDK